MMMDGRKEAVRATGPSPKELYPDQIEMLSNYRIIDVRERDEFDGPLGHIEGAELVPLSTVDARSQDWDLDAPLLVVCRSGGRSGRACALLRAKGFRHVTNLGGGMLAWRGTHPA